MNSNRSICLFACMLCVVSCGLFAPLLAQASDDWTWQNPLPTGNDLYAVSFVNANTGTVVGWGGTIARTTDGGVTWVVQSSGTTVDLFGVSFTDANTGTVVGRGGSCKPMTQIADAEMTGRRRESGVVGS